MLFLDTPKYSAPARPARRADKASRVDLNAWWKVFREFRKLSNIPYCGHFKGCKMFVRNGHLAIAFHANVAVENGRSTPLVVEIPGNARPLQT